MTFDTTEPSVPVTARWAPITSLFMRLTSAPVWVRVKNAIGMRCTWSNSAVAQVEDQALADPGRQPALDQREHGGPERGHHHQEGEHGQVALVGAAAQRRRRSA